MIIEELQLLTYPLGILRVCVDLKTDIVRTQHTLYLFQAFQAFQWGIFKLSGGNVGDFFELVCQMCHAAVLHKFSNASKAHFMIGE